MKSYNLANYLRYKEDLKQSMPKDKFYDYYTRDELIIKFLPLVETMARKFSTDSRASGVLTIMDMIQCGSEALVKAVDKLDWSLLEDSEDIEKTLKSFFSKRIKGHIRRRIDIGRGTMRIPEHKLNEIRSNPRDKKMVAMFFNSIFLPELCRYLLPDRGLNLLLLAFTVPVTVEADFNNARSGALGSFTPAVSKTPCGTNTPTPNLSPSPGSMIRESSSKANAGMSSIPTCLVPSESVLPGDVTL